VLRLCIKLYLGIRLTTEENHGKTSVGVAEKRPAAERRARFVWSTWSADRHHLWLAPLVTWANHRSDIYRVAGLRGPPHQLTSSRNSQGSSDVVGEKWNSEILVNLPVTHVPRGTSSNATTLGLKHL
jgi:hypothetical protein